MCIIAAKPAGKAMPTRDTIPHRLLAQASQRPATLAYQHKVDGHWQPKTWRDFAQEVRTAARALIARHFGSHSPPPIREHDDTLASTDHLFGRITLAERGHSY